jgi:hypothetical protein
MEWGGDGNVCGNPNGREADMSIEGLRSQKRGPFLGKMGMGNWRCGIDGRGVWRWGKWALHAEVAV